MRLTEIIKSKKLKTIVLEALTGHINQGIPLADNIFRHGSEAYFEMINTARKMKAAGVLTQLDQDSEELLASDAGTTAVFEGKTVWLDTPFIEESHNSDNIPAVREAVKGLKKKVKIVKGPHTGKIGWIREIKHGMHTKAPKTYNIDLESGGEANGLSATDLRLVKEVAEEEKKKGADGKACWKGYRYAGTEKGKDKCIPVSEAEYQGNTVDLNKPKRGGSKKFYVYVKDPKTGNVKKVSFGAKDGGGNLSVKLKDPARRKAFADRHNCEQKNDKTKPGYWACRLPRFAKSLGLSGGGTWW